MDEVAQARLFSGVGSQDTADGSSSLCDVVEVDDGAVGKGLREFMSTAGDQHDVACDAGWRAVDESIQEHVHPAGWTWRTECALASESYEL